MDELVECLSQFKLGNRRAERVAERVPERVPEQVPIKERSDDQSGKEEVEKLKHDIKCMILSNQILDLHNHLRQRNKHFLAIMRVRQFLYDCFRSELNHFDLFVVGSSLNGFGSRYSAIDLCLLKELPNEEDRAIFLIVIGIFNLKSELRDMEYQFFAGDRPFKLSCRDKSIVINFDVNKPLFIRNTQLIRCYSRMDGRVQPLGSAIREWAELNEISELSNYSLVLMLIHYLQINCSPAVLPVLQMSLPNSFRPDTDVRQLEIDVELPPFEPTNRRSLGELLIGFLDYYGNQFDYDHDVISIRNNRTIKRSDTVKERLVLLDEGRLPGETKFSIEKSAHFDLLYVEDPIDLSNTASSITHPDALISVRKKFKKSLEQLTKTNNLFSIFDRRL